MPNIDSHAEALARAWEHILRWHRDPLQVLFDAPAYVPDGAS
jgi:hypothetical protein